MGQSTYLINSRTNNDLNNGINDEGGHDDDVNEDADADNS